MALVEDRSDFYDKVIAGNHIRNLKDAEGKKMSDNYLVTKIDSLYNGFKELYDKVSGHVHFSNEHMFLNTTRIDGENGKFELHSYIDGRDRYKLFEKVDFSFNMHQVAKSLYRLLGGYRKSMEGFLESV